MTRQRRGEGYLHRVVLLAWLIVGCGGPTATPSDAAPPGDGGHADSAPEVPPPPLPSPLVVITSPRGPTAATELASLQLSGALGGEITSLRYRVERSGETPREGTITPAPRWTSDPLALGAGDNRIIIVARTASGAEAEDELTVTSNPGLRLEPAEVTPTELLVGQTGKVRVTLLIRDRTLVTSETVELVGVDQAGAPQGAALGLLTDDGVSPDEQERDAVFTAELDVDTSQPREQRLRVRLTYEDDAGEERVGLSPIFAVSVFPTISDTDAQRFEDAGEAAHTAYAGALAAGSTKEAALAATVKAIEKLPGVAEAGVDPTGYSLSWTMDWGMNGVFVDAPDGIRGGGPPATSRSAVLLEPFATEFGQWAEANRAEELLKLCRCPTLDPIEKYLDKEATLDQFRTMHRFGVIFIDSHGGIDRHGRLFITLEQPIDWQARADPTTLVAQDANAKRIGGVFDFKKPKVDGRHPATYAIYPAFVRHYSRPMPKDSLVYLGTCMGAYGPAFAQAFLGNGAGAFTAFTGRVENGWAYSVASELLDQLRQGRTAKEATAKVREKVGWKDPQNPHTWFVLLPSSSATVITEDACDGRMSIIDNANYLEGTSGPLVSGTVRYQSVDRLRPSPFEPNAYIMESAFKTCSGAVEKRNADTNSRVGWESRYGDLSETYADPTKVNLDPDLRVHVRKLVIDRTAKTAQVYIVPEGARRSQDDWVTISGWQVATGARFDEGGCSFAGGVDGIPGWNSLSDYVSFAPSELELTAQGIKGKKLVQNEKGSAIIEFDYALPQ